MKYSKFFKYSLPIGIVGVVINLILFVTNAYYELVVPVIENSGIEGGLFTFLDYLVYLTPCIFMLLFIAYIVAGQIYMRKLNSSSMNIIRTALIADLPDQRTRKSVRFVAHH